MTNHRSGIRGFSLIELMVTLAIVAVLMVVAVPSLTTFQRNAQLTSFTNTMLSAINAARGEAMKRGMYAMVVPVDGTSWDSGWIVFVDVDKSGDYSATSTDIKILNSDPKPSYLTITGNGVTAGTSPYIMFNASGYSAKKGSGFPGNLTFEIKRNDVSGSDSLAQTRRLKIEVTGRVKVCTPKTTTDADCSASASSL